MRADQQRERVRAPRLVGAGAGRAARARWIALLGSFLFCAAAGCDAEAEAPAPRRDAPWRIDEGRTGPERKPVTYRLVSGQGLDLALPARFATPQGRLEGLSGTIEFHPARLTHVTGQIAIDLQKLVMLPTDPDELEQLEARQGKKAEQARRTLAAVRRLGSWTAQAQHWLGLGADSTTADAFDTRLAVFELAFARDLSYPRASAGARRRPEGEEGELRIVDATVQGRLSLRGFGVDRSVPVRLTFHYDHPAELGDLPDALDVSLRGHFQVPLAEYDVRARDAAGHELATVQDGVAPLVGTTARVSGDLRFERAEMAPSAP